MDGKNGREHPHRNKFMVTVLAASLLGTRYSGCEWRDSRQPQRLGSLSSQDVRCRAETQRRRRKPFSVVRRDDPGRPAVRRVRRVPAAGRAGLRGWSRRERAVRRDARGEVERHSRSACDAPRRRAMDSSLHGWRRRRRQPRVLSRLGDRTRTCYPHRSPRRLP